MSLCNNPSRKKYSKRWEVSHQSPKRIWFKGIHDLEGCSFEGFEVRGVVDDMVCVFDFLDERSLGVNSGEGIFFRKAVPSFDSLQLDFWRASLFSSLKVKRTNMLYITVLMSYFILDNKQVSLKRKECYQ